MTEPTTQVTKIEQNLKIMATSTQAISVEQYLETLGLLTPQMTDRIKALQGELPQTTQTVLEWHYLPELPPEPTGTLHTERYLVASDFVIHESWYDGDGKWSFSFYGSSEVRAWAAWPEVPPVRE